MATAVLAPPKPAPVPRPLRWTVADFHRIGETGVFDGRRPVLIRGVIVEQGRMSPVHATGIELTSEALRIAFGPDWLPRSQLPLVLGLDTDPLPDVAMVRGSARDYAGQHPTTAALVVEVSDTTLALDMTEKAELYAEAGIADYWIVDVTGRRLLVFRDPVPVAGGPAAYRTHLTLGPADGATPLAAPNSTIPVSDLLP
jgi:Uma2 family endonuclease